jgi:hypothetical protein
VKGIKWVNKFWKRENKKLWNPAIITRVIRLINAGLRTKHESQMNGLTYASVLGLQYRQTHRNIFSNHSNAHIPESTCCKSSQNVLLSLYGTNCKKYRQIILKEMMKMPDYFQKTHCLTHVLHKPACKTGLFPCKTCIENVDSLVLESRCS